MQPPPSNLVNRMGHSILWEMGHRGNGITVAILDTGMILRPKFADRIVYEKDFTGEKVPRNKTYRHGNKIAQAALCIAPEATIGNCRVVPTNDKITRNTVVSALRHCIEVFPRYKIVNISLSFVPKGCPNECILCNAVDDAYRKGILVVVAAGNEGPEKGTLTCPALANWALTTIATRTRKEQEWWDELPWYKRFWFKEVTGRFGEIYGTSYSAGYASGAAAVLLSAFPKLDADTLRFTMLEISQAARRENGQITLRVDHVYDKLKQIQRLASITMVTKPGALHGIVKPF